MQTLFSELRSALQAPDVEFAFSDAKRIIDQLYAMCSEPENAIDSQERFHNLFFYEICPLLKIAESIDPTPTRLALMGQNSRFDARLSFGEEVRPQTVELTAAIDGHNDALQAELIRKRGHAPAFQKIEAAGSKHNRKFGKNDLNSFRPEDYINDVLSKLLEEAIQRKVTVAENNAHYEGAWLGIVFDDHLASRNEQKQERFDPVCERIIGRNSTKFAPFSRVFCVGSSRRYIFDSCPR